MMPLLLAQKRKGKKLTRDNLSLKARGKKLEKNMLVLEQQRQSSRLSGTTPSGYLIMCCFYIMLVRNRLPTIPKGKVIPLDKF